MNRPVRQPAQTNQRPCVNWYNVPASKSKCDGTLDFRAVVSAATLYVSCAFLHSLESTRRLHLLHHSNAYALKPVGRHWRVISFHRHKKNSDGFEYIHVDTPETRTCHCYTGCRYTCDSEKEVEEGYTGTEKEVEEGCTGMQLLGRCW